VAELNFAEVFKQLQSAGLTTDPSQMGSFLEKSGLTAEPEAIKKMLENMGLGDDIQSKEGIAALINQLTAGLGGQTRHQIKGLLEQAVSQMGCEKLPDDLADFLDQWNKGE
jgi:hypothetical protein